MLSGGGVGAEKDCVNAEVGVCWIEDVWYDGFRFEL
jgi:hypothetical protein